MPENFIESFEYSENWFYFYAHDAFPVSDMEKALLYFGYSDEIYEEAKEYSDRNELGFRGRMEL